MKRIRLNIDGMTCGHCEATVQNALSRLDGVVSCNVRLDENIADVEFHDSIGMSEISDAVSNAGFRVSGFSPFPIGDGARDEAS